MERGTFFNLPNSISLSRLLLAFAFVAIDGTWERVTLIIAAATTDFLDGWLARRAKSASVAGALIDPIADRLFVLAAVSSYLIEGRLTTGQFIIFLSRDIMTAIGFIVARFIPGLTAASFRARFLGKAVTGLQLATLFAVLVAPSSVQVLVILIGLLSAASIVDYTAALERARRAASKKNAALLILGAAGGFITGSVAEGQGSRLEGRVDAIISRTSAVHAGLGLTFHTGTYLRSGIVAGIGGGGDGLSGRLDIVNRFHLDPFRESRWAPYAGGGVSGRIDDERRVYLLLLVGVDGPVSRGLTTTVEAGLGGGGRIGVIVRRAAAERR